MDNAVALPGYKRFLDPATGEAPAVLVVFLDLVAAPGDVVDGVLLEVSDVELAELDGRERNYTRVEVGGGIRGGAAGRVWAYVGTAEGRARCAAGRERGTAVVAREYLERVGAERPDLPVRDLVRVPVGDRDTYYTL